MTGKALTKPDDIQPPTKYCNARTKGVAARSRCRRPAGWGTDHVGQGRCKLHGGATPSRHGRYSLIKRERIRDLIEQHATDPAPLDIFPELAALRALFQDFIERYDENTEALLAWHASFQLTRRPLPEDLVCAFERVILEWEIRLKEDDEPSESQEADIAQATRFMEILRLGTGDAKPRTVLDISDAYRILAEIGRMVERVEKIRSANAISRPELNRIMQEMWRAVEARIPDDALRGAIRDDWLRVQL